MSRNKRRIPLTDAISIAERAASAVFHEFGSAYICGSIRRMSPTIGDVDIVVCSVVDVGRAGRSLAETFGSAEPDLTNDAVRPRVCHTVPTQFGPFDVDVWMVPAEQLGGAVMHATGSGVFNSLVRRWARMHGMVFDVHGVHADGELISATEEECFAALGLPFFRPQDRHQDSFGPWLDEMNDHHARDASIAGETSTRNP